MGGRFWPWKKQRQTLRAKKGTGLPWLKKRWHETTSDLATTVAAVVLSLYLAISWVAGGQARGGEPINAFGIWHAEAARLFLPNHIPEVPIESGKCALYLGSSGSFTVVFDPREHTVYRILSSQAVMVTGGRLSDVKKVPECSPP